MNTDLSFCRRYWTLLLYGCVISLAIMGIVFFWEDIWLLLIKWQREINNVILGGIKSIEGKPFFSSLTLLLLSLSFLYGIIHAAGPGHGKVILCTNLLTKEKGFKSAFLGASFAAATHVLSALILTLFLKFIFDSVGHFARMNINSMFMKVNGYVIISLGMLTLILTFSAKLKNRLKCIKNDKFMGVVAGMVPCPATMTVLVISMAHSQILIGMCAVGTIVFGIFITLLIPSLLTVVLRDRLLPLLEGNENRGKYIFRSIGILQALFFILIGSIWIV